MDYSLKNKSDEYKKSACTVRGRRGGAFEVKKMKRRRKLRVFKEHYNFSTTKPVRYDSTHV